MKIEELHKKINDFFSSIGINNINIRFDPQIEIITTIATPPHNQIEEYIGHDISINFQTKLEQGDKTK